MEHDPVWIGQPMISGEHRVLLNVKIKLCVPQKVLNLFEN
jgi:hypothetical protein